MYICTTFENVPPRKTYYVFFRKLVKKAYVYVPEKRIRFPKNVYVRLFGRTYTCFRRCGDMLVVLLARHATKHIRFVAWL
jgi:hypothetical protein